MNRPIFKSEIATPILEDFRFSVVGEPQIACAVAGLNVFCRPSHVERLAAFLAFIALAAGVASGSVDSIQGVKDCRGVSNIFKPSGGRITPSLANVSPDRTIPAVGAIAGVVASGNHVSVKTVFPRVGYAVSVRHDAHAATIYVPLHIQVLHPPFAKANVASHYPEALLFFAVREQKCVRSNFVADLKRTRAKDSLAVSHDSYLNYGKWSEPHGVDSAVAARFILADLVTAGEQSCIRIAA